MTVNRAVLYAVFTLIITGLPLRFSCAVWAPGLAAVAWVLEVGLALDVAVVLVVGWIPLVITASHQLATQNFDLPWQVWACLVYAVFGPLVITNILWFTAISRVGPSRATLFANVQPFFAALIAVVVQSEPHSWLQITGGAAIGLALILSRVQQRVPQEPLAD